MKRFFKDKSDFDYLVDGMVIIKPVNWEEVIDEEVVELEEKVPILGCENEFIVDEECLWTDYDLYDYKESFMSGLNFFLFIRHLDSLEPWFCIVIEANKIIDVQVPVSEEKVQVFYQVEKVVNLLKLKYDPLQLFLADHDEETFYDVDSELCVEERNYIEDYEKRIHPGKQILPYL